MMPIILVTTNVKVNLMFTHNYSLHLQYFQETAKSRLMMVNDPANDMIVARIGMKTYLITEEGKVNETAIELSMKIRNNKSYDIAKPDFEGPLTAVPAAVDSLLKM